MRFIKMQACGNDYIYVDCMHDLRLTELAAAPPTSLIMALCDRHCGVGADGVVFITLGVRYRMTIYNADGSRAKTCGNALRCVAHYLFTRYGVIFPLSIDTDSGTRMITQASAAPPRYTVQMGRADTVGIGDACGYDYRLVDVGNRHVAVCCDDVRRIALDKEANDLCAAIAQGALNVEFYLKQGEQQLRMRVCEYGTGVTLGCGSGACAVAYAACTDGLCTFGVPIRVCMDGGEVEVLCHKSGYVLLTGGAEIVFRGEYDE